MDGVAQTIGYIVLLYAGVFVILYGLLFSVPELTRLFGHFLLLEMVLAFFIVCIIVCIKVAIFPIDICSRIVPRFD